MSPYYPYYDQTFTAEDWAETVSDLIPSFIISGYEVKQTTGQAGTLNITVTAGTARVKGYAQWRTTDTVLTMNASVTNYIWLKYDDTLIIDTTGSSQADSMKIAEVVTDASKVTSITDYREFGRYVKSGKVFPSSPKEGEVFYRTDEDKVYVYDGTSWINIGKLSDATPLDIALTGSAGTSSEASRSDHVHKHPVFTSGDLHTEYYKQSGDTRDLEVGGKLSEGGTYNCARAHRVRSSDFDIVNYSGSGVFKLAIVFGHGGWLRRILVYIDGTLWVDQYGVDALFNAHCDSFTFVAGNKKFTSSLRVRITGQGAPDTNEIGGVAIYYT